MLADEAAGGDHEIARARPGAGAAVGIGHALHRAGGVLGLAAERLEMLGRGFGGIVELKVREGAFGQPVLRREAGVGVFGGEARHGHGAFEQLGAALGRDVGAGDGGLALADEHAQAEIAGLLALDLLQLTEPDADGKGLAFAHHGLGRVGPGLQGPADQVMQQIFVHGAIWGRRGPCRKSARGPSGVFA